MKEYWHSVFEPFLRDFEGGAATEPRPRVQSTHQVGALLRHRDGARRGHPRHGTLRQGGAAGPLDDPRRPRLLRGVDPRKDQSYFLASVRGDALRRACFPLGGLTKTEVKALASGPASMPTAVTSRRSSAGSVSSDASAISAISSTSTSRSAARLDRGRGDRNLDGTKSTRAGKVRVRGGRLHRGEHRGLARYTVGQRARVGGAPVPWYVVGKDATPGVDIVVVAPGPDHPALFASSAAVGRCFWVAGRNPFGDGRGHGEERQRRRQCQGHQRRRGGGCVRATARAGAVRRRAVACEVRLVPRGERPRSSRRREDRRPSLATTRTTGTS